MNPDAEEATRDNKDGNAEEDQVFVHKRVGNKWGGVK